MCCQSSSEVLFGRIFCAGIYLMKNSMESQINKPEIKHISYFVRWRGVYYALGYLVQSKLMFSPDIIKFNSTILFVQVLWPFWLCTAELILILLNNFLIFFCLKPLLLSWKWLVCILENIIHTSGRAFTGFCGRLTWEITIWQKVIGSKVQTDRYLDIARHWNIKETCATHDLKAGI